MPRAVVANDEFDAGWRNMYTSQDAILTGWLTETKRMGSLIDKVSESLLLLAGKRATLEEKIIARQLKSIASALASLLKEIFIALADAKAVAFEDALGALRETNLKLDEALSEFLKIARYDPNFLEQYFEHDFCRRLLEDDRFLDVLGWIEIRFKTPG
jgi:hypothetical protein